MNAITNHPTVKLLNNPELGIIPRVVEALFDAVSEADESIEFTFKVTYVEIYMEKIRDLLDETRVKVMHYCHNYFHNDCYNYRYNYYCHCCQHRYTWRSFDLLTQRSRSSLLFCFTAVFTVDIITAVLQLLLAIINRCFRKFTL